MLDLTFSPVGLAYIDKDQAAALSNVEVHAEDVLVNITGDSVARVCMVDSTILPARVNQHVAIVRANPETFDQRYLLYALVDPRMKQRLLSIASAGATRNALTKSDLERLKIIRPPLREQQHIAMLLGALDDKIELNRRIAETLEAMARALFKSWFVDFDPVRAKVEGRPTGLSDDLATLFPDSLGESGLPTGWDIKPLKALLRNVVQRVQPSLETAARPYVPIDAIGAKSLTSIASKPGAEAQSSLVAFEADDILFGAMRPYFHKVALAPFAGTTRTTVFVLRPYRPDDLAFTLLLASEESTIDFATNSSSGSTIPYAVWDGSLATMEVPVPPPEIRQSFQSLVFPTLRRAQAALDQSRTLAELRDTLLPKLISGELRIAEAEKKVSAA